MRRCVGCSFWGRTTGWLGTSVLIRLRSAVPRGEPTAAAAGKSVRQELA